MNKNQFRWILALTICVGGAVLATPTWLGSVLTPALNIASGGSNKALTLAAGGVLWTDADSFEVSAVGTSGQCLKSTGTTAPAFGACVGTGSQRDDLDVPNAVATCTSVTATVTCTQGQHVEVTPLQDDAAWDTGVIWAFCEDTNTVKLVYCAPISGNPSASNDYIFDISTP